MRKFQERTVRRSSLSALPMMALLACAPVNAQTDYPGKPIQLIAQQPPGSASDAMTRIWADCASRLLGKPVVVQNRPGANGLLAVTTFKNQLADGYTLMSIGMSQMTITPYIYKQQPYDVNNDFESVAILGTTPFVLAVPADAGVSSLDDLKMLASKNGGLNYGSPGNGSPAHLLSSALLDHLGLNGTHVPFVGEAGGLTALMGSQIDAMVFVVGTAAAQANAGKLVPLVLFGAERSPLLPDVPVIGEVLPGARDLARPGWLAITARPGTSAAILERLHTVSQNCFDDVHFKARLEAMNVTPVRSGLGEARQWAKQDSDVWRPLIEKLGLVVD